MNKINWQALQHIVFKIFILSFIFLGCEKETEGGFLVFEDITNSSTTVSSLKEYNIVGDKLRLDLNLTLAQKKSMNMSMFFNSESGQFLITIPKMQKIISNPDLSQLSTAINKGRIDPVKTGRIKKHLGLDCFEYISKDGDKIVFEGCATSNKNLSLSEQESKVFQKLFTKVSSSSGNNFSNIDGIFIKYKVLDKEGSIVQSSSLKSFSRKKFSKDIFTIPGHFKR